MRSRDLTQQAGVLPVITVVTTLVVFSHPTGAGVVDSLPTAHVIVSNVRRSGTRSVEKDHRKGGLFACGESTPVR